MQDVIAKARYIRIAPRKVRLIANMVKGMDLPKAEAQLSFYAKEAARPVLKVLRSAAANAEHNFKIAPGGLYVKAITVDGGPVLQRWRPRAQGRAAGIKKRMSHITVTLASRAVEGTPKGVAAAAVKKPAAAKAAPEKKAAATKAAPKKADA